MFLTRIRHTVVIAADLGFLIRRPADAKIAEMRLITLVAGNVALRNPFGARPGLEAGVTIHLVHIFE